jgi:hypothetical protein
VLCLDDKMSAFKCISISSRFPCHRCSLIRMLLKERSRAS